jgi:4-hydroxybutyryl-CoA dehydratase/vinylacetyl-CoA-Delta-isomerase
MRREIWRRYPVPEKTALVQSLIERGVGPEGRISSRQPGKCCATGCMPLAAGNVEPTFAAPEGRDAR